MVNMKHRVTNMIQLAGLWALVFAVGAMVPVSAQDSEKSGTVEIKKSSDAKAAKPKVKTRGRTFTNADLNRMYGAVPEDEKPAQVEVPQSTGSSGSPDASAKSPLELMQAQQKSLRERDVKIAEAETSLEAAKQRVKDLEKRRLAVVNPLLARPAKPEEKEDAEAWDGMDAKQRRDRTAEQLEAAKKAVAAAEAELAAARRGS